MVMIEPFQPRERRRSLLRQYSARLNRIMEQNQAELAVIRGVRLERADTLMRNVVENSFDGILTIRSDGGIEMANDAACMAFGYAREEMIDQPFQLLFSEEHHQNSHLSDLFHLGHGHREVVGTKKDGKSFPIELAISDMRLDGERLFIAIVRDITERRAQQQQLEHQALHDALTGLPNRVLLMDRLDHALDVARRRGEPLALLLLDLDRFKEINDTLGHQVGDLLLRDVAQRLVTPLRRSDTIARLGGDEFAVLLPAVTDLVRAREVSERILRLLEDPFQVGQLLLEVRVSVGIAMFPEHADDQSRLLQCADVAMYTAKANRTGVELYDSDRDHNTVRHLTISGELRQAIEDGQLSFHYQPKLHLPTREVTQVEALARWHHPQHGFIPPEEFIVHAERTGLIEPLFLWEFNTALGQLADWHAAGHMIGMAINLSAGNLHKKSLVGMLEGLLDQWQVDPRYLTLEITESAIMVDPDAALEILRRLDQIGLRLSIDDFGTGYSSLAGLRQLPVDELKIDKSFVMDMMNSENDAVIVRSTIDLAHNLGLQVVAEGVEQEEHIALLAGLGCDVGQGFFISKPLPRDEINAWFETSPFPVGNAIDSCEALKRPIDRTEERGADAAAALPPPAPAKTARSAPPAQSDPMARVRLQRGGTLS